MVEVVEFGWCFVGDGFWHAKLWDVGIIFFLVYVGKVWKGKPQGCPSVGWVFICWGVICGYGRNLWKRDYIFTFRDG